MGSGVKPHARGRERVGAGPSPARASASKALDLIDRNGAYASDAIEQRIDQSDLSPEDKRFAAALVLGVVRTRGVLDRVLDGFLDKPQQVRPDVRRALRIASFELLFMGKEPFHAVDQGVRLASKSAPFARGLANAVLRKVAGLRSSFPFGDAAHDLDAFCTLHGFPHELGRSLASWMGEGRARIVIAQASEAPPVFLHVNQLADDPARTLASLVSSGVPFEQIDDVPGCVKLSSARDVAHDAVKDQIASGRVIVSDLAAQISAYLCVRDHLPSKLLEIGAGRGTKTVLIQSMAYAVHGRRIEEHVCVDAASSKRALLEERVLRCGAQVTECVVCDGCAVADALSGRSFDAVFLDAPCSGLGTLRRHPEIRWRVTAPDMAELSALQSDLLQSASQLVARGGHLFYSTCSIAPCENEGVAEGFLASSEGMPFRFEAGLSTVGSADGADSHHIVSLVRAG